MPVEIEGAIPFPERRVHASYDGEQAQRFWLALVEIERIFKVFRGRFIGKASPVHLFWGGLDLAVTRFSGRPAPPHPGRRAALRAARDARGVLARGEQRRLLAGRGRTRASSTPTPTPNQTGTGTLRSVPRTRFYSRSWASSCCPTRRRRPADDPRQVLLEFLQSTYEAAADCASWDRAALERHG